jgi:putative flippase GtrA
MIRREIGIFLIVGALTVVVDFCVYRSLGWAGMRVDIAKAAGFLAGTVFAYFANRMWTFNHARHAAGSALRFALLYATTLGANVAVNGMVLSSLAGSSAAVQIAFLIATAVSAALNFVGMKFFVFKPLALSEVE